MYSRFYRRAFLIATVLLLGMALVKILDPFWGALGWGAVLAFLLHPLHRWLTRKLNGRKSAAAATLTILTPFVILLPLAALAVVFARQGIALATYLRGRTLAITYPALLAKLEAYPVIGPAMRMLRENYTVTAEQLQGWLENGAQSALHSAASLGGTAVLSLFGTLVGFFLMIFLLFFLLRDGGEIIAHLSRLVPLTTAHRARLLAYLGEVTQAVVYGTAMAASIHGVLIGIGFAIAGLPSPVVFGVLGAFATFIPSVGTALVLVPAVLYLAFTAQWGHAIFLAIWSLLVGVSDNFLRPLIAAHRADVSTLAIFIGAIGGIAAFGLIGLVIGPVLLSLVVALVRFAERNIQQID